jgi:periplasmic copper chaperone A
MLSACARSASWNTMTPNPLRRAALGLLMVCFATVAVAHGGRAGDISITHPFATPTPAGATQGAAYIATLENTGRTPDRLLRASTRAATRVELHTMAVDASQVMRMRELPDLPLAAGETVRMRPGGGVHLMLVGLRGPLKEGDSFPLTLEFERGGRTEVKVVVQVPKPRAGASGQTQHH